MEMDGMCIIQFIKLEKELMLRQQILNQKRESMF